MVLALPWCGVCVRARVLFACVNMNGGCGSRCGFVCGAGFSPPARMPGTRVNSCVSALMCACASALGCGELCLWVCLCVCTGTRGSMFPFGGKIFTSVYLCIYSLCALWELGCVSVCVCVSTQVSLSTPYGWISWNKGTPFSGCSFILLPPNPFPIPSYKLQKLSNEEFIAQSRLLQTSMISPVLPGMPPSFFFCSVKPSSIHQVRAPLCRVRSLVTSDSIRWAPCGLSNISLLQPER